MSDDPQNMERTLLRQPTPTWTEIRAELDHATKAYEYLSTGTFSTDPEVTKAMIDAADIHAKLAVHDKIEELSQTIKSCTNRLLDANAKLDQDVKTAAQHLHRDAAEIKQHLRLIHGEEAA